MLKETIEAALFLSSQPLNLGKLVEITGASSLEIKKAIEELKVKYNENSGIKLIEHSDTFQLIVNPKVLPKVKNLSPYKDLSRALLKTLSIIAFKGPIKQSALVNTIGNRAYEYVKELEKRGLISARKVGRTRVLRTTKLFSDYFGVEARKTNLKEFI